MALVRCPHCDTLTLEGGYMVHKCPPQFLVWCEEQGETEDDAHMIYATNAEEAAEKWADGEDTNSADYLIVSQRWEPEVQVKNVATGTKTTFSVSGEAVPSYSATQISTEDEDS